MALKDIFKRKKPAPPPWLELSADSGEGPALSPEVIAALCGKNSPLSPEEAVAEAVAHGGTAVRPQLMALLAGEKPYIAAALAAILESWDGDCRRALLSELNALPARGRLVVLTAFPTADPAPLLPVLDELEPEELFAAMQLLAHGDARALDALRAYLQSADWRLCMRAATALVEAGRRETYADIAAARDRAEGILQAGLTELLTNAAANHQTEGGSQ